MTLWAIVPVKPLRRGKSRLSGTLSEDERTHLNQLLLEHTLQTLTDLKEIEQILVVSRDPAALALAREHGARTVRETAGSPQLNTALTRATVVAQLYATRGVLVLPADLPLISHADIQALVERWFALLENPSGTQSESAMPWRKFPFASETPVFTLNFWR